MTVGTTPTSSTLAIAGPKETFARFRESLRGHGVELSLVITVLIGAAALGLVMPWAMGTSVDIAIDGGTAAEVWRLGAVMAVATIGSAMLTGLGVALSSRLFETSLARLRERMVAAALRLPLSRVEAAGSGDLVSRATDDVSAVSIAISQVVPALATSVFTIALTLVGLALLDVRFLIVAIVVLPVHVLAVRMYLKHAPPIYAAERAAMAERAHHVLGSIHGLDTARAFVLTHVLGARIASFSWSVVRWEMRARTVQNRFFARLNLGEFLGMATILVIGFVLVGNGGLTVGATTTAMLFFLRLFGPIGELLMVIDDLQSGLASLGRMAGVIAEGERSPTQARTATPHGRDVSLTGVNFGYVPGRQVLHDVSLSIADGEHVALVGSSGAGKSTVATILAGVHAADSGRVQFGGVDLSDMSEADRAQRIALVTQEVHVFAGSIADDLRMAAPASTDEQITAALATVSALDWTARLPHGIDTVVGAEGHDLSPTQVQQLALARLVLLDPRFVILDEATADAGSAGADVLERSAAAALVGRSALIVAHRLSQAARADRVVLMERGRVVEEGAHADLVARGGRYATLWAAWSRGRA
jgi:ATP-binding cassette subfamily C protein